MELAALAISAATLLAKSFIDAAASDAGKSSWSGARRLYESIRDKFAGQPYAEMSLERVQAQPESRAGVESLAGFLEASAAQDPEFRRWLIDLVTEADAAEPVGAVVNQFFGDVRIGKHVTMRDVHGTVNI